MSSKGAQKRAEQAKRLAKEIAGYATVGLINMHKLPARQLLEIKSKLAGKAVIKMAKK